MGNQSSKSTLTAQDKAIFQLKRQRDSLKQYQKKLHLVIDKQMEGARAALRESKPEKAKIYLKLKKQQQTVVGSTYEQLAKLEGLIGTIEFKLIEKDVYNGLMEGNKVLKKLNAELSVDKIDKVMDDIEGEVLRTDEIADLLGSKLSLVEELEVDGELRALELEVLGAKGPELPHLPELPNQMVQEMPYAPIKPVNEQPNKKPKESESEELNTSLAA